MTYVLPGIDGIAELWGADAFHCPFCHGWEHRDGALAVLGATAAGHRARLLRGWSRDVTVLADGEPLTDEDAAALATAGIDVDPRPVAALERNGDGRLAAIRFTDGDRLARTGVLLVTPLRSRTDLPRRLGASVCSDSPINPEALVVDDWGRTSVPGLSAAGDLVVPAPQVVAAMATGSQAAAGLVQDMM